MKKLSLICVVLLLAWVSQMQAKDPCSVYTINGTYAFELSGSMFFGNATSTAGVFAGPLVGVTIVGEFTIGAAGQATGYYWMASGLNNSMDSTLPWNAKFTVNPDCTGELQYNSLIDGLPITEKMVILDNGAEIRTIVHGLTTPAMYGTVWETTAWRIAVANQAQPWCAPNSLVGEYVIRCAGWDVAPNGMMLPSMMLAKARIEHGGDFTGTAFMTVGPGTVSNIPISGNFVLNPNCTTAAVMTLGPLGTVVAKGVFYDNGNNGRGMPMFHQEDPTNHHSIGNMCTFTRMQK